VLLEKEELSLEGSVEFRGFPSGEFSLERGLMQGTLSLLSFLT